MLLNFSNWLIFNILGFTPGSRLGEMLSFFLYDTVKILLLLFVVIFIIGVMRSYLSRRKLKKWMQKGGIIAYIFAALFGAVTPFCSCSSIPIFFGFIAAGIPLGVVFTFLIVSPLINQYLVVLMGSLFGWTIASIYVVNGIVIGMAAGAILGKLNLERYIVEDIFKEENGNGESFPDFKSRIRYGFDEAVSITAKIWYWVVAGVAAGALIYNYVPQAAIEAAIGKAGILGVPIAVILGVPMYGSCAAIVPIALVFFQKGVPLGTALSFMMAVAALSLPAAIMLRRAIKIQMIIIYFAVTTAAIIFTGYLFNILQVFF